MLANHVSVALDPRASHEKVVETYGYLSNDRPALTSATRVRYDEVVSHGAYGGRLRRNALLDDTFFRAGVRVLIDPGEIAGHRPDGRPLRRIADVPANSMNETACHRACNVDVGRPA